MRRCVWAAAAACLLLLAACAQGETKAWEGELLAMDTIMKLTLYGENAPQAGAAAMDRIRELEGLLGLGADTGGLGLTAGKTLGPFGVGVPGLAQLRRQGGGEGQAAVSV